MDWLYFLSFPLLQASRWTSRGTAAGPSTRRWQRRPETSTGGGPTDDVSVGGAATRQGEGIVSLSVDLYVVLSLSIYREGG